MSIQQQKKDEQFAEDLIDGKLNNQFQGQQSDRKLMSSQDNNLYQNYQEQNNNNINNQQSKLAQTLFRIRCKIAARMMINSTNTKMLEQLQPIQYYLINDKAANFDYNIIRNQQTKKINLITLETEEELKKRRKKKRDVIMNYFFKFSLFVHINQLIALSKKIFNKIPVISPSSLFKYCWDFFHMNLILIYLFLIPIHISFGIPFSNLISQEIADMAPISFIIDTLINLNTGYYDKGIAVQNKFKILLNYIKNNFISDILAVIPNIIYHYSIAQTKENYDPNAQQTYSMNLSYIIRFFLLFFFMKLNSFNEIIKKLEERLHLNKRMSNIIQFIKLLFTIVIIAHIFACLWVFIANIESYNDMETWMDFLEISQADWKVKYIRAYYFSVVTMITVGYGDVLPKTEYEMILSIISIMISCGVYAYLFNEVGSLFNAFQRNSKLMKHNMQVINLYMHEKNINSHLQYQVRDYLEYFWQEQMDRDEEGEQCIINQLSDELKQKLLVEANKIILKDSPIFADNFSNLVIQKTISLIQEQRILPEQIIIQEGSIENNSIFFIEKGCVEIVIANPSSQDGLLSLKTLKKGDCFGADSFFTGCAHKLTIRSKEFTTLLFIKREDFINLLKEFPEDYEHFSVLKDQILLNSQYQLIDMRCQSCGSYRHTNIECKYIHYQPIKRQVINKYNKKNNNDQRQEYVRQNPSQKVNTLKLCMDVQDAAQEFAEENEEIIEDFLVTIGQNNKLKYYQLKSTQFDFSDDIFQNQLELQMGNQNNNENIIYEQEKTEKSSGSSDLNVINKNSKTSITQIEQNSLDSQQVDRGTESLTNLKYEEEKKPQTDKQQLLRKRQISIDKANNSNNIYDQNGSISITGGSDQSKQSKKRCSISNNNPSINRLSQSNFIGLKSTTESTSNINQKKMIDFLNIKFKMIYDQINQNNEVKLAQKDQDQNEKIDVINQNFECAKNFSIYFPYNNLDYQLQLIQLPLQQKKFLTSRIIIDNLLHYKKLIANKETLYGQQNDTMNKLIQKYQKEKEQQVEQARLQFDLKSIHQPTNREKLQKSHNKRNQNSEEIRNSLMQLSQQFSPDITAQVNPSQLPHSQFRKQKVKSNCNSQQEENVVEMEGDHQTDNKHYQNINELKINKQFHNFEMDQK